LTAQGRLQATAAATAIADFAQTRGLTLESVIDCSPLRRAWETAHLLSLGLEANTGRAFACREFAELAERSLGALANLSVDAIESIVSDDPRFAPPPPNWKRNSDFRLPFLGCESLNEAGARVARHLRACAQALEGPTRLKLLVGHGGAFRHAAQELGVLSRAQVSELSMDYCVPIYLDCQSAAGTPERFVHVAGQWRQRSTSSQPD
jgi:2,3-bisphosphoglycerate-dependent phosphoglycerate mutase